MMNYEPIDTFLTRAKQMTRSGSKDMRLSLQEANMLAISIAELLGQLQRQAPVTALAPTVIDGGSFTDRAG
jgi:hypothetical protein